jgi:hypothetical protein
MDLIGSQTGSDEELLDEPSCAEHSPLDIVLRARDLLLDLVLEADLLVVFPSRLLASLVAVVGLEAARASQAVVLAAICAELHHVSARRGGHGDVVWWRRGVVASW